MSTPLHTDLLTQPIDSNNFITFWCPLEKRQQNESIQFAVGSHRDISMHHWFNLQNVASFDKFVEKRFETASFDFEVGDCSVHHGWLLHSAPRTKQSSTAITFSFVPKGTKALTLNKRKMVAKEDFVATRRWLMTNDNDLIIK